MRNFISVLCFISVFPALAEAGDKKTAPQVPMVVAQAQQQNDWGALDQTERNRILRILRDSKLYVGDDLVVTNQTLSPEILRNPLCVAACHAAYAIAVSACGGVPICLVAAETARQICISRC